MIHHAWFTGKLRVLQDLTYVGEEFILKSAASLSLGTLDSAYTVVTVDIFTCSVQSHSRTVHIARIHKHSLKTDDAESHLDTRTREAIIRT